MRGRRRPARADGEEEMIRERAAAAGAVETEIIDAREEYARDFLVPALRANALYEGKYPLVSALSRPVIVQHLVASARRHGADAVGHGCTGQGQRPGALRGVVADPRARSRRDGAGARVGSHPRRLHRARGQVGDPDLGVEGEAVLDRREHVGPRDRVRRPRESVVRRARRPVHADAEHEGRAVGADRDRRRVRTRSARFAERQRARSRRVDRDDRPHRRRLRLGSHRHGREPPGRHQEPRGLRVPGVARADPCAQGPRRHHARARPRAGEAARRDPRRGADLRRHVARAADAARSPRSSTRPKNT